MAGKAGIFLPIELLALRRQLWVMACATWDFWHSLIQERHHDVITHIDRLLFREGKGWHPGLHEGTNLVRLLEEAE